MSRNAKLEIPDGPSTSESLKLGSVKCGQCTYFEGVPYFKAPCAQLGRKAYSKPCKHFDVNTRQVSFSVDKWPQLLSELIRPMSEQELALATAILNREALTRKHGYHFGERVYVRVRAKDFVSNYAVASVVRADKNYVYVSGSHGYHGQFYHNTIVKEKDFDRLKARLIKQGKINDPAVKGDWLFTVAEMVVRQPNIAKSGEPDPRHGRQLKVDKKKLVVTNNGKAKTGKGQQPTVRKVRG